jgi:hypothetical protein
MRPLGGRSGWRGNAGHIARHTTPAVTIEVELVEACSPEIVEAFCRDEPRLSSRPSRLTPETSAYMVASSAYQLLVARRNGGRRGTLTIAVYQAPRGVKARIDDVVAEQTEDGEAASVALLQEAVGR